jgi:1,5-anhydro-D-fructose reductase (1,5-anhydro-D-mannitol-forming)
MLDETKPAFVLIGSPPFLHQEHIRLCAERNIPVLCEKPLCLSTSEAESIQSLLAPRPIPFRIAHHLRHQPGVTALREIIAGAAFGKLQRVAMQWGFWLNEKAPNASWKLDPSTGGPNAFYDAGVHAIDLMLHLLPYPTTVTAVGQQSRFQTTVDNVSALVLCGETSVEISASQSIRCPLNSLTLDFEGGTISIPDAMSEQSFTSIESILPAETVPRIFEPVNLYGKEIEDFIALIKGQASVGTTLQEACHALQILEAITESYSTGRTIALHDSLLVHG